MFVPAHMPDYSLAGHYLYIFLLARPSGFFSCFFYKKNGHLAIGTIVYYCVLVLGSWGNQKFAKVTSPK